MEAPKVLNHLYRMYLNIFKFMEYRKFVPKCEQISESDFIKELRMSEYIIVKAETAEGRPVYIFLVDENSDYGSAANEFEMLEFVIKKKKNQEVDMIVIAKDKPSIHLKRKIAVFKKHKTYVSMYDYDKFKAVIPEAPIVPLHEIIPVDQVEAVLAEEHITDINQLPKIKESDPMAVWLGIVSGDLVRITGPSESAGEMIKYRVCI